MGTNSNGNYNQKRGEKQAFPQVMQVNVSTRERNEKTLLWGHYSVLSIDEIKNKVIRVRYLQSDANETKQHETSL